jgi:Ca2+-transporting ATPase
VLTVFLALGATRLSRRRVLTRRLAAIEALGSASVLCTDKTGTLTENRMRIAQLDTGERAIVVSEASLPEAYHEIVEYGVLASAPDPFDPMEIAFRKLAESSAAEHLHRDWELVREYPLSHALLSMSHAWRQRGAKELVIAAKGAPEAIFDLCHLSPSELVQMRERVRLLASQGLRVLGVARARFAGGVLPSLQHDFEFELVGLSGLEDPLRAGAAEAVRECKSASIRVLMITGDYPETARVIGERAGLVGGRGPLLGEEVERLSSAELCTRLQETEIVARASPAHKLDIIKALSLDKQVVAMTGDGVNDAPALKAAHIGIAMGGRGSDVAREAAALVVTDDDFSSIVAAIRLGRRIFDNLQKAMAYVVAFHVPVAGMALVPVLLGRPLALFPVHIVLLELIVDPVCSIVFEAEAEEPAIMRRPPRGFGQPVFSARVLGMSLLQGASILLVTLWVYLDALTRNEAAAARSLAFTCLIASNVALVLMNRSWRSSTFKSLFARNVALWIVLSFASSTLALALFVPAVSRLFGFAFTGLFELAVAAALGVLSLAWFELVKWAAPSWSEPPSVK